MPEFDDFTEEVMSALFKEERKLAGGESCEVCGVNGAHILCDYEVGSGITTSIGFKELTSLCDKALCQECATRLWPNCDVCPEHAYKVRMLLVSKSLRKLKARE